MKTYLIITLLAISFLFGNRSLASSNNSHFLIGPRSNIATSTPIDYGFWSFAVPVKGILSRSGQPTINEFKWLKSKDYKSIVNLRFDNEYKEIADDKKLIGFTKLNFNYLHLPVIDGAAPSNQQAETFLKFIKNKNNQPALVHCRGGYGRTGTMVALYRYEIQKWKMNTAIKESRLFHGGISDTQKKWLLAWAKNHPKNKIN